MKNFTFFKDKNKSIFFGNYIFIIISSITILITFYTYEIQLVTSEIISDVQNIKKNLVSKYKNVTDFAQVSAKLAEEHYNFFQSNKYQNSNLFNYLKYNSEKGGFTLDSLPEEFKKAKFGNLTLVSKASQLSNEKKVEVNMALSMADSFRIILDKITDSPWIYYTSNDFIFMSPYVSANDFFFNKEVLTNKEFYKKGLPEINPLKKPFWTKAYVDEAGKGLMTTYSVPIYNKNLFLGTLSIDVTIDQFNHILSQFSNESGELFLFNNNQQLLAAPKIVSSKDNNILNIKNVFSKKFIESMNRSAKVISTSDSLSSSDKYYILVSNFPDFEATLLYRIKKTELWWKIIDQTKIFLILFFIGVLLVFRNVLNMLKINIQQKDLEKSEALLKETQKISKICSWEFNSLTNELIFSENVNFFFPALKIENIASLENIKQWVTEDYQNSWEKHLVTSISQEQEVHFEGVLNPSLTNLSSKVEKIASLVARSQKTEPNHFILRGTIQDITQRKELENIIETERAMNVQNSKLAALGEMSANIAHEINNPLAIIVANTHRLKKSIVTSTPEQVSVILNTIESMSKRISSTIKGLRAFSRDAHNDPLQKYQLNNLISDVLIITQERFKVSNIHFSYPENIPDNILLECNPTQISQVLINLLMNSFDSISTLDDKWVKLEVKITDTRIDFIVTDSGKGIDKDIADKIFQPFFSTKEVGKGTGIGLSISKGLIEAHNGHIFLDSSSQNTRFVIQLPRNKTGDIS